MMSRLMLNLHEKAELGIWSISDRSTYYGNPRDGGTMEESRSSAVIELDTIVTEDRAGTRGSITPPGLERIDEEPEGAEGTVQALQPRRLSFAAGLARIV
ncbi:hypothetical protein NP233_g8790 [Leucocoprinus birnbaumii]|uniref:Uncharacterized protein n=1 Tax=Leucocoprinus birnbaumii TaxID=56174 RepID=A0AAD5VLS4_9AGAR|nr:hypothetical protein NP233_g8790 [Leucocoprinus birnbaumii]